MKALAVPQNRKECVFTAGLICQNLPGMHKLRSKRMTTRSRPGTMRRHFDLRSRLVGGGNMTLKQFRSGLNAK